MIIKKKKKKEKFSCLDHLNKTILNPAFSTVPGSGKAILYTKLNEGIHFGSTELDYCPYQEFLK